MAYYHQCPHCGSNLDPCESCDCQKNAVLSERTTAVPKGGERFDAGARIKDRGGTILGRHNNQLGVC